MKFVPSTNIRCTQKEFSNLEVFKHTCMKRPSNPGSVYSPFAMFASGHTQQSNQHNYILILHVFSIDYEISKLCTQEIAPFQIHLPVSMVSESDLSTDTQGKQSTRFLSVLFISSVRSATKAVIWRR